MHFEWRRDKGDKKGSSIYQFYSSNAPNSWGWIRPKLYLHADVGGRYVQDGGSACGILSDRQWGGPPLGTAYRCQEQLLIWADSVSAHCGTHTYIAPGFPKPR